MRARDTFRARDTMTARDTMKARYFMRIDREIAHLALLENADLKYSYIKRGDVISNQYGTRQSTDVSM